MMLTREEFYILNNLYNSSLGRAAARNDLALDRALRNSELFRQLTGKGFIDGQTGGLTDAGLESLRPYKVDNAVILAAGPATRFVPLSLEQPKGLYEVKGEKLIERQIKQLLDAGISDITVVLGYKKEMFFFLKEKYGVKFVINPLYNMKNNIESLYLSGSELKSTYVCVCDSYYIENPFNQFEYASLYTGFSTEHQESEMYVQIDDDNRIVRMEEHLEGGLMLLGHSYWTHAFSDAFRRLVERVHKTGDYDDKFWEWLVKDNLEDMPSMFFEEYAPGSIYEFDYFEQLRRFDNNYVGHTHSEIIRNIKLVFRCDEEDITEFRKVNEGLTNTSFIFRINGKDYIYRHPGEGTESIINRKNEKSSLITAKRFGIDPTYVYMDADEGWKISEFVHEFREPDYNSFEDSKKILAVLKKLHSLDLTVDYGMQPWEDSLLMERLLKEKDRDCFLEHETLKSKIETLYSKTVGDGIEKCFCHGDTYRPNWMIEPDGNVILIDWEYSGYSDPGIDIGYYIVDAMYEYDEAIRFIKEYLKEDWTEQKEFHYMAYTAIIAYYWFVWATYRESCGANMGEALENWHYMAVKYSDFLIS